ncbi:MAG: hypothetical protein H6895_12070 [Defluviimonas sp.]|uniref:DUF6869 domain-containing protein n=1 Tax=Albidovulum sp. TaxID=1872424 RepID=UPI001DE9545A|nr:hypothetical protein [Paracoccaceae bacterium]MCC0064807.1 hypothetical protein [Defluviimonas sp.]
MTPLPADLVTRVCAEAGAPDDIRTVEALVPLWLADNREERDEGDFPWSTLCVFELREHPEECWAFVRRALSEAETVWQVVMLAAGPLEDLIADHGAAVIDRIEREARHSARFHFALTGVWPQGGEDSPVWSRIEAARAAAMATGIDAGGPLPGR